MSAKQTTPKTQDGDNVRDVAIDVRANDLVHIGQDTENRNHYYDAQRERILVVSGEHEEYTPEDTILTRRRLVVGAENVHHVHEGASPEQIVRYLEFVDEEVDGLEWADVAVTVLGEGFQNALRGGLS